MSLVDTRLCRCVESGQKPHKIWPDSVIDFKALSKLSDAWPKGSDFGHPLYKKTVDNAWSLDMKKYLVGLCISIIIAMLAPNLAKAVDATKINPKEGWRLKCDENFCAATHTMTIKDQGFPLCIMHISNQALVGSQISPNGGEFRAMCSLMSPPPEIILVFEKEEVPISIYSFNNNYAYAHLDILNYRSQITHKKHFKIRIPESETKVSGKSIKIREAIYTVPTAGLKEAIEAIIELNKSRHGITTK